MELAEPLGHSLRLATSSWSKLEEEQSNKYCIESAKVNS